MQRNRRQKSHAWAPLMIVILTITMVYQYFAMITIFTSYSTGMILAMITIFTSYATGMILAIITIFTAYATGLTLPRDDLITTYLDSGIFFHPIYLPHQHTHFHQISYSTPPIGKLKSIPTTCTQPLLST
jgi:hypothetical protein